MTYSNYIRDRIVNFYHDGGRYFIGEYNEDALRYIDEVRTKFPSSTYTDFTYYTERSIQRYTHVKKIFADALEGSILDVGSRDDTAERIFGKKVELIDKNNPDAKPFNWDVEKLPYADNSFDTLVCLDTLEHITSIHDGVDDLIRVAKRNVIISLPNCWRREFRRIKRGYGSGASYGFPPERPFDRHHWYFNTDEIVEGLAYRAYVHGARVTFVSYHAPITLLRNKILFSFVRRFLSERYFNNFFVETVYVRIEKTK